MENTLVLRNSFPPVTNFNAYKTYVLSIPNLSEEQERSLLENLKVNNCLQSAQNLIMSQLKTVIKIVKQYKNYGLPEEDLVQEGNIGLMKAVKNFDISYKVRLYSYALLWIKAEIQNYILKNWKIVKIGTTKNLKKLFFNYRQIQKEMIDLGIPKNQIEKVVSEKLSVSSEEIKDISNYFNGSDISLNIEENEDDEYTPLLQLTDNKSPEKDFMKKHDNSVRENLFLSVMDKLNERQKDVIKMRYFEDPKKTHKEISEILNVSSERIRQIENESILKMKKIIQKEYGVNEAF